MMKVILTSEKLQDGHFLKNRELSLYIGGKRYDEYLSHNERVECLEAATVEFDNELQKAAEYFRDHPYGAYLWLYTPDFIRGEEIRGLYKQMYIKAIINRILKELSIKEVQVYTPLSPYLMDYLRNLPIKFTCNKLKQAVNLLQNCLQNTKTLFILFSFNIKQLFKQVNEPFTGTLIDTSPVFKNNRYDDLDKVARIFNNKVKYYCGDQVEVQGCLESQTVVFKKELTLTDFLTALVKSFRISRFIKQNVSNIPPGLYYNHKGVFKMLLYWDLLLAQKSINKYFDKCNIKTIVQVSTFTKPIYRSLVAAASKRSITFIQVASRSLMRYRCSERLLQCDIDEYSSTAIPDWFIVKDQYSTRVFNPYPKVRSRVLTAGRFKSEEIVNTESNKPPALLIMFNHRKDISYRLLNEVLKSELSSSFKTIIVRCHPNFTFPRGFLKSVFSENDVVDITGGNFSCLRNYQTTCISGPTTGSLDAINNGAVILWITYIWEDGILMNDIITSFGLFCADRMDLKKKVYKITTQDDFFGMLFNRDQQRLEEMFSSKEVMSNTIMEVMKFMSTPDKN